MPTSKSRADDLKRFFSFEGRATRTEWWIVTVVGLLAVGLSFWLAVKLAQWSVIGIGMVQLQVVLSVLAYGWLDLATNVRRLHDMGRSGWWAALFFLLNGLGQLVAMVWLGFFDGTPGGNRFGPNPRVTRQCTEE